MRYTYLVKKAEKNRKQHPELKGKFDEIEKIANLDNKSWERCKVVNNHTINVCELEGKKALKIEIEIEDDFNRVSKLLMVRNYFRKSKSSSVVLLPIRLFGAFFNFLFCRMR